MKFDRLLIKLSNPHEKFDVFTYPRSVSGFVVGNPFPADGSFIDFRALVSMLEKIRKSGLYAGFQTPVYLTAGNFENWMNLLEFLMERDLVSEIFLQDLGVLSRLKKKNPEKIRLCWSIYGWQREFPGMDIPMNQLQVDFFESMGVENFEITTAVAFSIIKNRFPLNFKKNLCYYRFDPVSFSRFPYSEIFDSLGAPAQRNPIKTSEIPIEKNICSRFGRDVFFLQQEDGRGLSYVVEGCRLLEIPDEKEFEFILGADEHYESFILEDPAEGSVDKIINRIQG